MASQQMGGRWAAQPLDGSTPEFKSDKSEPTALTLCVLTQRYHYHIAQDNGHDARQGWHQDVSGLDFCIH